MNIEIPLNSNKNKKSVNKDFYQTLAFEKNSMVMPVSNINNTINTYKVFDDERNNCTKYRLNLTLNPLMTNVLANKLSIISDSNNTILSGQTRLNAINTINDITYNYKLGYDIFDNHFMRVNTFKTGNTINAFTGTSLYNLSTIEDTVSNNLIEDNGWLCLTNKTKINNIRMFSKYKPCEKIDLFPTREYFSFKQMVINNEIKDNWDLLLTYPYKNCIDNKLTINNNGINGIPIVSYDIVITLDFKYLIIATPYKHGLNVNDVIKLKDVTPSDKTYLVYNTGDINGNNKEYSFILDANKYSDLLTLPNITNKRIVKVIDKTDSIYYIRIFRKLPNLSLETEPINEVNINNKVLTGDTYFDKEIYQPGFARNIFNDSITQIQYIDTIDVNHLKDNLNRPLSELYLTILKRNILNGNNEPENIFTKITSGIDALPGTTGYTNIRYNEVLEDRITSTGSTINIDKLENSYLGDIVEYNPIKVKEVKLDDIYHRFNTIDRERTDNIFTYHTIDTNGMYYTTQINLQSENEGYYYKPHYKIQLKNYSAIINEGELEKIDNCFNFESGITYDNQIVLLSTQTDENIKYLILKLTSISGYTNNDKIRITNINGNYISSNINVLSSTNNTISFIYNKNFMPNVHQITIDDYVIRKYKSSDIPLYAQDLNNGKCLWRNILREGVFDAESIRKNELVFTNDSLYITEQFNFNLKRQDPFGYYNLRNDIFPNDLVGIKTNNDIINNKVNNINQIC